MIEHETTVAMQFEDAAQQRLSAVLGMWAFLATEVLFFGGMFAGYVVYRSLYPQAWAEASRELDVVWGTLNTAVLLTSSWTMALAVDAAHTGNRKRIQTFLACTIALAAVFLSIKGYEYAHKWHEHLVPGSAFEWSSTSPGPAQLFFLFYFIMTGCHALHMLIGIGALSTIWWGARQERYSPDYYTPVELVGLYWHFVDVIWVFLFPLLYLIDRS